jgi:hypothetical protein
LIGTELADRVLHERYVENVLDLDRLFDQAFGDEKAQIFAETLFMTAPSGDIPFGIMLLKRSRSFRPVVFMMRSTTASDPDHRSARAPGGVIVDSRRGANVATRAIKRDAAPEDLIGALLFLSSADSDFMTGQTIVVDGGSVMR